jgi:hypothetical protein
MLVVDLLGGLTSQRWLAREAACTAMARPHRRHGRLHGRKVQGGGLENPRRQRHPLARWHGPWPDQPLDPRRTAPSLLGGLLKRQPVFRRGEMRQPIRRPHPRDTVRSPGLPGPGARAQPIERGRNRQGTTDLGELAGSPPCPRDRSYGHASQPDGVRRAPRCVPRRASAEARRARGAPGWC